MISLTFREKALLNFPGNVLKSHSEECLLCDEKSGQTDSEH